MTLHHPSGARAQLTQHERALYGAELALDSIPDELRSARESLAQRGVAGAQHDTASNALAMYLRARTGLVWLVDAASARCHLAGRTIVCSHSGASRALVVAIQQGLTPELYDTPSTGSCGPYSALQLATQRAGRQ